MKFSIKILSTLVSVLVLCLITAGMLSLGGCSNFFGAGGGGLDGDGEEETGTFTINFGNVIKSTSSRSAVKYPPDLPKFPNPGAPEMKDLKFILEFTPVDGKNKKETFTFLGEQPGNSKIAIGKYKVEMKVYLLADDSYLYAQGSAQDGTVEIKAGNNEIKVVVYNANGKTVIDDVSISVVMSTATPPSTSAPAGGTGYTCSTVTWSCECADPCACGWTQAHPFVIKTIYKATVTLTAASGYTLAGLDTAEINGKTATITDKTDTSAKLSAKLAPDPILLTISGVTAPTRPYNGSTTVVLSFTGVSFTGLDGSDTVTLSGTGTVANANVGLGKSVTTDIRIDETGDGAYYKLSVQPTDVTVDITQKVLTISSTGITKVYDGNNNVTDWGTLSFSGLENGETANVDRTSVTGAFSQSNAGSDLPITRTGNFGMSGDTATASNYSITQPSFTGSITRAPGAAVGVPAVNGTPTTTSITVSAVSLQTATGQSIEYAISITSSPEPSFGWQPGTTFSGLSADTDYYVFARSVSSTNYEAGEASVSAAIKTASGPTPTVTNVFISPQGSPTVPVGVCPDSTLQFSAYVQGTNNPSQTVTWSVSGGSGTTNINVNTGLLTVDPNQTANLTVTAKSSADTSKTDTATLTLYNISNENIFTVTNTTEWNSALNSIRNGTGGVARIIINGNFTVNGLDSTTYSFGSRAYNIVFLEGSGTVSLSTQGHLINLNTDQTLIINGDVDNNGKDKLFLDGLRSGKNGAIQDNNAAVVNVARGTKLELRSGTITGNTSSSTSSGTGVYVNTNFTMTGGSISGNIASSTTGAGVYVTTNGNFTMTGGTISGNKANYGGGVGVNTNGTFTMSGGSITDNETSTAATLGGGGVFVFQGNFIMKGGSISGNRDMTYNGHGGGIHLNEGSFTMEGGSISANTTTTSTISGGSGGGVYVCRASFSKTGGTIYGKDEGANSNTAYNDTLGHAVYYINTYVSEEYYCDTTLDATVGGDISTTGGLPATSNETLNNWTMK